MSKPFPIHTCNFFNIFIHSEYIETLKNAELTYFKCPSEAYAILSSPIEPQTTPGFRVLLNTIPGYSYFMEVVATLIEGKDAFIYIEDQTGVKLIPRENRFCMCNEMCYTISFEAISSKTYIGLMFFYTDVVNKLRITQFRCCPFLDVNNLVDENLTNWKCVTGQFGQPLGCQDCNCTIPDTSDAVELFEGDQGVQGTQGVQGVQGVQGSSIAGPQGVMGFQGISGGTGPNGFQGMVGSQGIQGPQGSSGLIGPPGFQGPQGVQGNTGELGFQGPQGSTGSTGPRGFQGVAGETALSGTWVALFNRPSGGSQTTTVNIPYQKINNTVSLYFPTTTFTAPFVPSILQSSASTPLPSAISPISTQTTMTILKAGPTTSIVRGTISPTDLTFSSNLETGTVFGIANIQLYGTTITYYIG